MKAPTRKDAPTFGFRADIRRTLYQAFKYELGCPGESNCALYEKSQEAACQPCSKHLTPVEAPVFSGALRRLRLIFWLEGLIDAGAQFWATELSPRIWEDLANLKAERNRFERILMEQRDQKNQEQRREQAEIQKARKLDGLPGPGQTLFGQGTNAKAPRRR